MEAVTFPATPSAIRRARHHLVAFLLADDVDADACATAGLLASELATNAVMHAGTDFTLAADIGRDAVRVEVSDGSTELPEVRRPPAGAVGGRGLHLVQELSSGWGTDVEGRGKRVWFELAR
jgi:anti-sigma regulatory factor (Ser/Thr protein kinase)